MLSEKEKLQFLSGIKESVKKEDSKEIIKESVEPLQEARYDNVSGFIVDRIWKFIKSSKEKYDSNPRLFQLQETVEYIDTDLINTLEKSDLKFSFILKVYRDKTLGYPFDLSSEPEADDIEILIKLNPLVETKGYNELNAKLQNLVRHETEHLTQLRGDEDEPADSFKQGKASPTDEKLKDKLRAIMHSKNFEELSEPEKQTVRGKVVEFFTLRDEIPALVHGLYREAKTKKTELDTIFQEYLDEFSHMITQEDKNKIENQWLRFSITHLPAAKYTERARNKIVILRDLLPSKKVSTGVPKEI